MPLSIALFGLSGNPPTYTGGHTGIVRYLVKSRLFRQIWILPVYKHIYDKNKQLESFEHRMAMCKLSFEEESSCDCPIQVLDIEKVVQDSHANKIGTIDVVNYIKEHYDVEINLILGGDTFNDLANGKWKGGTRLVSYITTRIIVEQVI